MLSHFVRCCQIEHSRLKPLSHYLWQDRGSGFSREFLGSRQILGLWDSSDPAPIHIA